MKIYKSIGKIQRNLVIKKDKQNTFYKDSKYADINNVLELIYPELEKEGLILSQPVITIEERLAIKTIITDGTDKIESLTILPELQDSQKIGSAITYFRRYSLVSLLGLMAEEDDDGNKASGKETKAKIPTIEL